MSSTLRNKKQPLVRIDIMDKMVLDKLAAKTGESTPKLLHRAVTQLNKELFFEQMNRGYRNLRNDSEAWKSEMEDRALFENTLGDGLD